jgi:hypothetical protein
MLTMPCRAIASLSSELSLAGLARQGAKVLLNGFGSPMESSARAAEMKSATDSRVAYSVADMSKPEEIHRMFRRTRICRTPSDRTSTHAHCLGGPDAQCPRSQGVHRHGHGKQAAVAQAWTGMFAEGV